MQSSKIAFIGGGNMTRAIAGGLIRGGFEPADIVISEPLAEARAALLKSLAGTHVIDSNGEAAAAGDCLVLAVKPQVLAAVCRNLSTAVQASRPLIISIAAGVRIEDLDAWLGGGLPIVRVMPNQPALIGLGVSGLYANRLAKPADRDLARSILAAVGSVVWLHREADLDAVTAVSGSGPAYFFLLIDMIAAAAEALGIDPPSARTLAVETARGAAELAAREDTAMEDLIARVRSPGGTTAAALDSLDAAGVRAIFADAITAARDRAIELADAAHNDQMSS